MYMCMCSIDSRRSPLVNAISQGPLVQKLVILYVGYYLTDHEMKGFRSRFSDFLENGGHLIFSRPCENDISWTAGPNDPWFFI